MKKVFFTILFFALALGMIVNAQQSDFSNYFLGKQTIPLKGINKENGGKDDLHRSVILMPVVAYICDKTIGLDFLVPLAEEITVIITNIDTGEVIHSEIYYSPDNVIIQLNRDKGNYYIDIVSESLTLQGEFTL